jgi:endo-1,4-beta-xylanase
VTNNLLFFCPLLVLVACSNSSGTRASNAGGQSNAGGTEAGGDSSSLGGAVSDASSVADAMAPIILDGSTSCDVSALPAKFSWYSTGALISAIPDATHKLVAVKDPTIVYYNDKWHVYATSVDTGGAWSMVYLNFTDFAQAGNAKQYHLSDNPNFGKDYHCAPQIFYFRPQDKWYLIYQSQQPQYSTTDDPSKPETWTAPKDFFASIPDIVAANQGGGTWLDYWVICDDINCYLFFSDDNGHYYRAQTAVTDFPNGFGNVTIVMQDANKNNLFEASNVYKLKGLNKYLALIEALGSDGHRFFRSWTADSLDGTWTPLADTVDNPFAGLKNVTFAPDASIFTWDISHGEMLRDGYDETLTIDPCNMHYLYQGASPFGQSATYSLIKWKLALLSQTQ